MHTDGVMEMAGSHAMCQHKLMGSQPKLGLLLMHVQTQHALHMKAHTSKAACTSQGLATTASAAATPAKPADCKGSRKHKSSRSSQTKTASNSYTDRSCAAASVARHAAHNTHLAANTPDHTCSPPFRYWQWALQLQHCWTTASHAGQVQASELAHLQTDWTLLWHMPWTTTQLHIAAHVYTL